ncbi:MAG TPA: helix-turn-helix domain-containing protein [Ktedonobacterales bacterium]|nr:helix-turn-helix domain-containing protein [Ktedonobacterales bacterium]
MSHTAVPEVSEAVAVRAVTTHTRQSTPLDRIVCPVARTAEIVSGKWTLLIIRDLTTGTKRFSELERSLEGISPKTLSERLTALEREGMLSRRTYAEVPPKVEYSLTEKGQALASLIEAMREYGTRWLGATGDCE